MTQREKIEILKTTVIFLYEKEGRSKSYIARLLEIDRKTLSITIEEWGLTKANISRLTPSNQKFANKNRAFIKSRLDKNISQIQIAKELGVGRDYLRNIISKDEVLNVANKHYKSRIEQRAVDNVNFQKESSSLNYDFVPLEGEEWKPILGHEKYFISNMGRVKKLAKRYKSFFILEDSIGTNKRKYVKIGDKNLQIARLVGFAFVEGHSESNNTIDHIDGDVLNNRHTNLEWVSQKENNVRAYNNGRKASRAYSKNGKFKNIVLDGIYEFKTLVALARFMKISTTQLQRYINNETTYSGKIEFVY